MHKKILRVLLIKKEVLIIMPMHRLPELTLNEIKSHKILSTKVNPLYIYMFSPIIHNNIQINFKFLKF